MTHINPYNDINDLYAFAAIAAYILFCVFFGKGRVKKEKDTTIVRYSHTQSEDHLSGQWNHEFIGF